VRPLAESSAGLLLTCRLVVFSLMNSLTPICSLVRPPARSARPRS